MVRSWLCGSLFILVTAAAGADPLTVAQVLEDYARDRGAAVDLYTRTVPAVTGPVAEVRRDFAGRPFVSLAPDGPRSQTAARFYFAEADVPALALLTVGQSLTLTGIPAPGLTGVAFTEAKIVENPAPASRTVYQSAVKAADLMAAYRRNALASSEAFQGKPVVLTGVIASVDSDFVTHAPILTLSGYEGLLLGIGGITAPLAKGTGPFTVGQSVTLTGTIGGYALGLDLLNPRLP